MTHWSDLSLTPSSRTLRQFAGLWMLFFSGLSAWQALVRGNTIAAVVLGILALTVGPMGCLWPMAIRGIYVAWMVLAFPIGWIVSRLVLALLFYGIFAPLGIAFRLFRRDPLQRQRRNVATYWVEKPAVTEASRYFKQF